MLRKYPISVLPSRRRTKCFSGKENRCRWVVVQNILKEAAEKSGAPKLATTQSPTSQTEGFLAKSLELGTSPPVFPLGCNLNTSYVAQVPPGAMVEGGTVYSEMGTIRGALYTFSSGSVQKCYSPTGLLKSLRSTVTSDGTKEITCNFFQHISVNAKLY